MAGPTVTVPSVVWVARPIGSASYPGYDPALVVATPATPAPPLNGTTAQVVKFAPVDGGNALAPQLLTVFVFADRSNAGGNNRTHADGGTLAASQV